ncbi:MAG: hypothetical protein HYW90_01005 [Candidatus Sungbacteria bacterium]|nr:hypothetical protein [Candidatus Sungbacteria bacterium]
MVRITVGGTRGHCGRHSNPQPLERVYDEELDNNFGCGELNYCPVLGCDFVIPKALGLEPGPLDAKKYHLLLMTAARQKAFFIKFVRHFVGDGK